MISDLYILLPFLPLSSHKGKRKESGDVPITPERVDQEAQTRKENLRGDQNTQIVGYTIRNFRKVLVSAPRYKECNE